MKGKYKTNNGEVNVVEYDPASKKARIEGGGWISESQHRNWVAIVDEPQPEPIAEIMEEAHAVNTAAEDAVVVPPVLEEIIIEPEEVVTEEVVEESIAQPAIEVVKKPKIEKKSKKK